MPAPAPETAAGRLETFRLPPRCQRAAAGLILALLCLFAHADNRKESIQADRFQLRLGVYWPDLDSSVSASGERLPGDTLDFERHLNLDERKTTFYGGLAWRFAERHVVDLEYFDLGREGRITAQRAWDINDRTVLAGARIDTSFDIQIARLSYQYRLLDRGRQILSLVAGVHHATLEAEMLLSGELVVDDRPVFVPAERTLTELRKTEAPLPNIGVGYIYAYSPDWTFHASLSGFSLAFDEYDGRLLEANLSMQFQVNRHLGIGGGFKYFDLDVEREKAATATDYEFGYVGPALFITGTF